MAQSLWQRLLHGARCSRAEPDWEQFAGSGWADRIMDVPVTDRFHAKQGRSIGRLVLHSFDSQLVVYLKRHYSLPWWQGLLTLLWPEANWSPAFQEWDNLQWARQRGLPVPRAVAACQYLVPGARLRSVLAVQELSGMLALHEAVPLASQQLSPQAFGSWKQGLIAELARLARILHDARWFHKDLYFCHFYISECDCQLTPATWQGRVSVIDLHRLAWHGWTWPWWQAKDLGQLLYSSHVDGITDGDRQHFWQMYQQGQSAGIVQRWVQWVVQLRTRNYLERNRRKPQVPGKQAQAA